MATRTLPTAVVAALGGLVGLVVNLTLPVPIVSGVDVVFGQIPVLAVALLFGWPAGLLAAAIAGLSSYFLWGHFLGMLALAAEAVLVGRWGHRIHPAMLVAAAWLLVTGPVLAVSTHSELTPAVNGAAVFMKGPLQAIFSALVVQVLLFLAPVRLAIRRFAPQARLPVVPLRSFQATFVALLIFAVAGAVLLVEGQHLYRDQREALVEQNAQAADSIAAETDATLRGYQRTMEVTAVIWERLRPDERASFATRLVAGRDLEGLLWLDGRYRSRMGIVDGEGGAFLPIVPGLDFRQYRPPAPGAASGATIQLVNRGAQEQPLLVTIVPVRPEGYLAGYISLDTLRSNLFRVAPPYPATIQLLDRRGRPLLSVDEGGPRSGPYDPIAVVGVGTVATTGWTVQVATPQRVLDAAVAATVASALPTLAIVLLFMAALGYALMVVLARDIREITHATRGLGREGAAPPEADSFLLEMRNLQRAYRWTADSLARTMRDLRTREAELTISNSKMAATVDQLKAIDQSRSEVLNTISHDIKIPLTAVQGYGELLEEELAGALNPTQQEFVQGIMDNTHRVVRLLEDLLELGRLEVGQFPIEPMPVDLGEVLARTQRNLVPLSDRQNQAVTLTLAPDLQPAVADPARLEQILNNLLSNAIKFTPEGGRIELRAYTSDGGREAVVEVIDSGIGIAPEHLAHLFERFYRVKGTNKPGTGLGLPISKKLVEAMGGRIGVISEVGRGSTFWFTLPLMRAGAPAIR